MDKSKRIVLVCTLVFLLCASFLFFSFDLVVYVYPEEFVSYESRLSRPHFINFGYILVSRTENSLTLIEKIKKPSLYIYTPYSNYDGDRLSFYALLDADGDRIELSYSESEMYSSFLSLFPDRIIGFCHNEYNSHYWDLYYSLKNDYPNLVDLAYTERISVVNVESLLERSSNSWGIIVTEPSSSSSLYRETDARVIMDERDAAFSVSLDSVISLHYDWNRMIREYLKSGETTSYYTFSVIHK